MPICLTDSRMEPGVAEPEVNSEHELDHKNGEKPTDINSQPERSASANAAIEINPPVSPSPSAFPPQPIDPSHNKEEKSDHCEEELMKAVQTDSGKHTYYDSRKADPQDSAN